MSVLTPLLVVGVVATVVVRRLIGEPLTARGLFVAPVALVGFGAYGLTKVDHLHAGHVAWIVAAGAAGVAFGVVRGLTVRVFVRNGELWHRYTGWTFLTWLVTGAASVGVALLSAQVGVPAEARSVALSMGVGLLGELVAIAPRALRTGVPFASASSSPSGALRSRPAMGPDR